MLSRLNRSYGRVAIRLGEGSGPGVRLADALMTATRIAKGMIDGNTPKALARLVVYSREFAAFLAAAHRLGRSQSK